MGMPMHVLVVDDEPVIAAVVRRTLRGRCAIDDVGSGEEALARIRAGHRYSLILCDLVMPRMTGLDVLDAMRREAPDQAERFIFVTGGGRTEIEQRRLETSGVFILWKPFDRTRLLAAVSEYLPTPIEAVGGGS